MFFDGDSSSGVSGDLESATTVASFMEGYWGMGKTVSSYATARRLEAGTPGGGNRRPRQRGHGPRADAVAGLADRIEDNLGRLLVRAEEILRENERQVLALAHALETHKTLSGEDVTAVFEGRAARWSTARPTRTTRSSTRLREYHPAAARAHREHSQPQCRCRSPSRRTPIADVQPGLTCTAPTGTATDQAASLDDDRLRRRPRHGERVDGPLGAPTYDRQLGGPRRRAA